MTALEEYVRDEARRERVAAVRRTLDELGVTYLYLQFVSVTGRVVGKGIPAAHWTSVAERGIQMVYGATANVVTNRYGRYLGYGPEASELVALPDPETFVQLPWDKRVGRVFCTLFHNREEQRAPGAFLTADCRGNLRRAHQAFRDNHGLHFRLGVEPEMLWLTKDEQGRPGDGFTEPYCYHIDQFERLRPVYMKVLEYGRAMGLDMIQGDHEDAPGQLELNFMFDDALQTADRLITYRQICAQVAREHGLYACFITKPFMGYSACGCHFNMSLWSGGEPSVNRLDHERLPGHEGVFTYLRGGDNHFVADRSQSRPSETASRSIAGIIAHLPALTALGCSTVNSYRRLWDLGLWAPVFADWGYQNRTCAIRVSAPDRVEYRAVDSMVNPYLMASALLAAFDDGLERKLDPGDPEDGNIYDKVAQEREARLLPRSLGQALDALERDPVISGALPGAMRRLFVEQKRDEWERFLATVTSWDIDMYKDYIP